MSGGGGSLVRRLRVLWLSLLMGALALILVDAIVLVLLGDVDWQTTLPGTILTVAGVVPAGASLGLLACAVMARGRLWEFMLASMAALVASMAGWAVIVILAVIGRAVEDPVPYKLATTATVLGAGLPLLGFLLTSPDKRRALAMLRGMLCALLILGGSAALLLMWSVWWQSRWFVLAGALGLAILGVLVCWMLLVVFTLRMQVRARARESLPRSLRLSLVCPGCEHEQSLPQGAGRCARCGLSLVIAIEEPRCTCGYLLYRLQGEQCPECGRRAVGSGAA